MKQFFYFVLFLFLIFASCKKNNDNAVANVSVDIYIYPSLPSYAALNPIGGWVYVTGGVRGILIYHKTTSEYMTYDRNCTYQSNQVAPCATVKVDNSNIIAVDSCCHSKFSIIDGSVTQGPAALSLKAYHNTYDGNVLHIYN